MTKPGDRVMVVEIELEDLVDILDEDTVIEPPRRVRWTPHHGITTRPEIRVGVMLGTRRVARAEGK